MRDLVARLFGLPAQRGPTVVTVSRHTLPPVLTRAQAVEYARGVIQRKYAGQDAPDGGR